MTKVRVRPETGTLYLDFFYAGVRCREQTRLPDTAENRLRLQTLLSRIEREIKQGSFDYAATFPSSPRAERFATGPEPGARRPGGTVRQPQPMLERSSPIFAKFAEQWFLEMSPRWRSSHRQGVREVLDRNLLPTFGARPLHEITKADVLAFRADLAKLPGRKGATLGSGRINKILCFLRQILNEAADRFEFPPAFRAIKPLKQKRADVQPFSLEEVQRILAAVRADYRDYLTVRFFTGMRTGEVNGLKWRNVDFQRNRILVRESVAGGEESDRLRTDSLHRDIAMPPLVRQAIDNRARERRPDCPWVFASKEGNPIDAQNFCNRVWYPLLRYLGLDSRRPYQTRHTAATLMLAAGENPEWIAQVMGHSTTAMLFKVYSRFVPNPTRQDGQAFAGLVHSRLAPMTDASPDSGRPNTEAAMAAIKNLSPTQLAALLALAQKAS